MPSSTGLLLLLIFVYQVLLSSTFLDLNMDDQARNPGLHVLVIGAGRAIHALHAS